MRYNWNCQRHTKDNCFSFIDDIEYSLRLTRIIILFCTYMSRTAIFSLFLRRCTSTTSVRVIFNYIIHRYSYAVTTAIYFLEIRCRRINIVYSLSREINNQTNRVLDKCWERERASRYIDKLTIRISFTHTSIRFVFHLKSSIYISMCWLIWQTCKHHVELYSSEWQSGFSFFSW